METLSKSRLTKQLAMSKKECVLLCRNVVFGTYGQYVTYNFDSYNLINEKGERVLKVEDLTPTVYLYE